MPATTRCNVVTGIGIAVLGCPSMSDVDQDQKTEQASDKKLSEAAERGQFAKSPELQVLLLLGASLCVLAFTAHTTARDIAEYSVGMFTRFAQLKLSADTIPAQLTELMLTVGRGLGPVLLACVIAAIVAAEFRAAFVSHPRHLVSNWKI